jgi:hypothetical protein
MQFGNHLKYEAIMKLTSNDIGSLLHEIKMIIENFIKNTLAQINTDAANSDIGAIDTEFLLHKRKLMAYTNTAELLINELNTLGHKLIPLDQDVDINFESTSMSWVTHNESAKVFGLDIEIFPSKANVLWVLSPKV